MSLIHANLDESISLHLVTTQNWQDSIELCGGDHVLSIVVATHDSTLLFQQQL